MSTQQNDKPTVLILDDDEFSQDVMIGMLEELGISKIRVASDGNDGLRVLKEMSVPPDVLICDILMPDMDGMSFLTELAKTDFKGRVALVSGIDSDILSIAEKVVRDDGLNIIGAFLKPIKLDHLRQIMSNPVAGA
ncbi:response regulator [Undibacterium cyanobacteriorum]|uniref:Response regulator n=1 Tax=Undibacterium cyanobacteriorum TaxID=3073561 RepID=A0ABY9RGQ6_9BURK|nr:response regulator [Undibacterium sp. 20NA77.5]WMW80038.1 response regulator [Undibacterium sp. 20NA77.5]